MFKPQLYSRLKLFSLQPFRWFALSGLFATFGNGLVYISISWMALEKTSSIALQALLMICLFAPTVFLGPLIGALVDKYCRKKFIIASNLIRGLLIICYYFCFQNQQESIYLLATGLGLFGCLYNPAANVFIREIVSDESLLNANSIMYVVYEFGSVFGMGVSGIFIILFSGIRTLLIGGICFLIAALCNYWMIYQSNTLNEKNKKDNLISECVESLRYLKSSRGLFSGYCTQMLIMVILTTLPVMLAPFIKQIMKADVNIFGYLEAAFSGGVVLGGLLLPFITELLGTKRVFTFLLLLLTGSLFLFSLSNNVIISCFMYGLIGASFSSWTLIMSKMQALTDMKFQGRLYSIFNSLGGLFVIITYLILIFYGSAITITKGYWIEAMIAIIALTLFNLHLKQIKYEYTT